MAARKGNKTGLALKEADIRQKAYILYCDHIAKGKSLRSWYYEDNLGNSCTWETMESYIKKNPEEFDPIKKSIAHCKGYNKWEEIAELSAKGENKANTASLQMVMRNKFGWDKDESKNGGNVTYILEVNSDLASGIDLSAEAVSTASDKGSK